MSKPFHIIAFDVPYPPNYGGIVDVFYKLKTLHGLGAKIIYHCFYYEGNNEPIDLLKEYCDTIYYYPRKKHIGKLLLSKYPFVVATRNDEKLLANLIKDDYSILFDGIQTCFFIDHPLLKDRRKLFRANNIEHVYYKSLGKWEPNSLKKLYYNWEAKKLTKFEKKLSHADVILSVAKMDIPHFSQYAETVHLPPFFNNHNNSTKDADQKFGLFQGNLSVTENIEAVLFIVNRIAPFIDYPIIIAGKSPNKKIIIAVQKQKNVSLIADPDQEEMNDLIASAQVNLLFTFQQTGIKLKLLHALESGKHVLINSFMDDSGIFSKMCKIADQPDEIIKAFSQLMEESYTNELAEIRKVEFDKYYNNQLNAEKILALLA